MFKKKKLIWEKKLTYLRNFGLEFEKNYCHI